MKKLAPPSVPDVTHLRDLSRNHRLDSHPFLKSHITDILKSYVAYRNAKGNPLDELAPKPRSLCPQQLTDALKLHYSKPPKLLKPFLSQIRKSGSADVCPMCGSLGTGTLDHVFPQKLFPELSFFSKNLVPACICNSLRKDALSDIGTGGRVLHPYFDDIMNIRLAAAEIFPSPTHGYEQPKITLANLVPTHNPNHQIVNYHLEKVIKPTQIFSHFDTSWPKLLRRPNDYFDLGNTPITSDQFRNSVNHALQKKDQHYGTPNNWESMLYAGISSDVAVCDFLADRANKVNNGAVQPEAI